MADILASINTRKTPQGEKARADQVKNRAGGYVFQIGDAEALHRFLTLGTATNSYYAKASELTRENADVVFRMAATKPDETIKAILDVSEGGRAPKNDQAIFALAICAADSVESTRQKALAVLPKVCRTATHLFQFNVYVTNFRGRGRALNRAMGAWYLDQPVKKVAYQAVKYRARKDWTHRDLLRLIKPGQYGVKTASQNSLFDFITKGTGPSVQLGEKLGDLEAYSVDLAIIQDYLDAKAATKSSEWIEIINRGNGVSWEMLPDAAMNDTGVWEAMLDRGVPATALMRQLPRLTNLGLTKGSYGQLIMGQLTDADRLIKAKVHPINVLVAQKTYGSGYSLKGSTHWTPTRGIVDALDASFYAAFGAVPPTGKRRLVALDISGSMDNTCHESGLSAREVASAMSLVTLATEPDAEIVGFTAKTVGARSTKYAPLGRTHQYYGSTNWNDHSGISRLDISPRRRLDDVISYVSGLALGRTDCALPFTWAQGEGLDFDSVEIYTDNETWAGPIHVHQALESYRQKVGHDVKLTAVGLTATNYSVVDPKDASGMNVSGFDSAVPNLIGDFIGDRL